MKKTVMLGILVSVIFGLASCMSMLTVKDSPVLESIEEKDPEMGYLYGSFKSLPTSSLNIAIVLEKENTDSSNSNEVSKKIRIVFEEGSIAESLVNGNISGKPSGPEGIKVYPVPQGNYSIQKILYLDPNGVESQSKMFPDQNLVGTFEVKANTAYYLGNWLGSGNIEFNGSYQQYNWSINGIYDFFNEETEALEEKFPSFSDLPRLNLFTRVVAEPGEKAEQVTAEAVSSGGEEAEGPQNTRMVLFTYIGKILGPTSDKVRKTVVLENDYYTLTLQPDLVFMLSDKATGDLYIGRAGFRVDPDDMAKSTAYFLFLDSMNEMTKDEFVDAEDSMEKSQIKLIPVFINDEIVRYEVLSSTLDMGETIEFNYQVQ